MAEKLVCAVYDKAAESFMNIFAVQSRGLAMRGFIDEVNRESDTNSLYRHSDDYGLYLVARFDEVSGLMAPVSPPELLLDGAAAKQIQQ